MNEFVFTELTKVFITVGVFISILAGVWAANKKGGKK